MKTFEVYSLYDTAYRGRVLVATVQADSFEADDNGVVFYKNGFFKSRQTGLVMAGGAFAVLDTEFSMALPGEKGDGNKTSNQVLNTFLAGVGTPTSTKKRSKKSSSDSLLKLDE